jgi:hypothetical protein
MRCLAPVIPSICIATYTAQQDQTFYIIPGLSGDEESCHQGDIADGTALDHFNNENWDFFTRTESQLVVKVRYNLLKGRRKQDGEL